MANTNQTQGIKPSQDFVSIKRIQNGIVEMKKGGVRRVLMVSGINFDLKSEGEQSIILNSFQNFLNTLDFPVQFFIHSRKINIQNYIQKMTERGNEETNELLKIQIDEYIQFIKSFVEENDIISKNFFVVVPYESASMSNVGSGIFGFLKKREESSKKENIEQENVGQLNHRVDQVVSGLSQLGLRAIPLEDDELIELYYNLYNPQLVEKKGIEIAKKT